VRFAEHMVLAALAIDTVGEKHVPGSRDAALASRARKIRTCLAAAENTAESRRSEILTGPAMIRNQG